MKGAYEHIKYDKLRPTSKTVPIVRDENGNMQPKEN